MEIKKIVQVSLESLYDLKPLHNLLKKSLPLFKDYKNIVKPEDLLSYKIFGTSLSLRNNILVKVKEAAPTPKAEIVEELNSLREKGDTMVCVFHQMPSQLAILFLDKSGIKYDYISHEEHRGCEKLLSGVSKDAETVNYGEEKPKKEEKKQAPKPKRSKSKRKKEEVEVKEEPKEEVKPIDAPAVEIKLEEKPIEEVSTPIVDKPEEN